MTYKVVLNAGHGAKGIGNSSSNGYDSGAIANDGFTEASETIEVVNILASFIKSSGNEVLVIQDGDLEDVTNQANVWKADYFISVHCNSASDPSAHGIETFALSVGGQGDKLAHAIQSNLISATQLTDRGVKYSNFWVLRKTDMPAILTEIGFISNQNEENLMKNPNWDIKVAKAIYKGICEVTGIQYVEQNNLNGVNDVLEVACLLFSKEDYFAGGDVALKYNCAIFIRPNDKSCPKEAFSAKQLIIVGGSDIPNHPNRIFLSGNTKFDTAYEVGKFLNK